MLLHYLIDENFGTRTKTTFSYTLWDYEKPMYE